MRVFQSFDEIENIPHPVLTIGTFDGVHLGHQKIIRQLNEVAESKNGESVLFTFYPHPRMVLFPENHGLKLIQTQEEKIRKLEEIGLKNIIVYPFSKEFSRIPALEFVRDFLVNKLKVKTLVIGYDHHFGRNREGDIHLLRELSSIYDFEVIEIAAKEIDDVNVSSTKIREALKTGDIALSNSYLGYEFELNGKVIHGEKLGAKLGFPTANLDLESDLKLIPKNGVYASRVTIANDNHSHFGLLSITERPTINDLKQISIEVNILDFDADVYGKKIKLNVLKHIRDDEKFVNLDVLKTAMQKDETVLRNWISTYHW